MIKKGGEKMIWIHISEDGTVSAESDIAFVDYTNCVKGWENVTLKEIVEDIKETEEMD